MYECFHCGERAVVWQADFTFDEVGLEGDGIVHFCICGNSGAEIQYRVPMEDNDEQIRNRIYQ